ncbi:small ubiquitin-related modifier 2-like [Vombatus ursinus]|uniref:small ubiquitin-related modifier 2-like n=1 Tax=Vombatus ursinus TaxID=29139 RepID=UPI000FFD478B|nr:small ubiquitin-related modifier 2-like [Vombatus ursinus]
MTSHLHSVHVVRLFTYCVPPQNTILVELRRLLLPQLALAYKKPKEGVKTENNSHINLKVARQGVLVVQFKIKIAPLSKLMKIYCEQQCFQSKLELEAEDTIDVFQQQTGGTY